MIKVGDWVKIKKSKNVQWAGYGYPDPGDDDYEPPPEDLCSVVFVVTGTGTHKDRPVFDVEPHPIFAGLFKVDDDGELEFNGIDVLNRYYDFEIKLVSNNEEQ